MSRKEINRITGAGLISLDNGKITIDKDWLVETLSKCYIDYQHSTNELLKPIVVNNSENINYDLYCYFYVYPNIDSYVVDIQDLCILDENENEYIINISTYELEQGIDKYLTEKL